MLTFRAGAASGGGAKKMADHLMNMTLPTFEQDMAAYYQRGMTGNVWRPGTEVAESNAAATAADAAQPGTVPEPRRDMAPSVAAALGIDLSRPLTRDEIAELLAGNRADGEKIAGKQYRRAVVPLAEALALDPMRLPTQEELANLIAGKRADGSALPPVAGMEPRGAVASRKDPDAEKGRDANASRPNGNEALRHDGAPARNETPTEKPRAIKVAEALAAVGVAYRRSGGRLRLKATWRGGDNWTVSVNATTGQWRDFAAGESGRFESLIRRIGVKVEAATLAPEEAKEAREREVKHDTARKSITGKLWTDAVPGIGELLGPNLHGSAAQRSRQRTEHAERVAEAEALRATVRAYLTKRGLDAEWLMDQVRSTRPHANYDASEIKAGATAVLLTPMFGKNEAGGVQLTGLQRTYLTESGEKIGRRMLGQAGAWLLQPPAGEAVALGAHEHVRLVGEGFETTASAVQATRQEGVVGYNAGGVVAWAEQFEGKEPVAILADRDNPRTFQGRDVGETGQKAAAKAASLIEARAGTALYLEPPARVVGDPKGADWADALREGGPEEVRQALAEAVASSAADRARIEAKIEALNAKSRDAHASRSDGTTQNERAAPEREETSQPAPHPDFIRLYKALGAKDSRALTAEERANILAGKRADGKDLDLMAWRNAVTHAQTPIGYFDFTFSADKSVSLAWAFAPTEAERNQIVLAHKDAVATTMAEIEQVIGQARKGKAGLGGTEPGHIGWITFDHYTARPTLEIAHRGPDGKMETEIASVKVAGDPQLHTHVAVPNVIVTDTGRVVSLNTLPMHGRIHEWGALYQAHLAQNLRKMGASVALDQETGAARLTAVPDEVRAAFSKRTRDALMDAKAYAASVGADWGRLSPDERIKLLKGGACASRTAKSDDLSDFASWRSQLEAKGYRHESVLGKEVEKASTEEARFDRAYEAAARVLAKQFEGRAVLKESDERVAAARGLVAAGIKDGADVDQVIARLHERGIPETGDDRSLFRRTKIIAVEAASGDQESLAREEIAAMRLTTRAHLAQESALVELAKQAGQDRSGVLTPAEIEHGIAASGLTFRGEHGAAQRRLLVHLGTSGRLVVGIGAAGAGKTTLLKPLVAAWHAEGADIHGISLGWRQARELRSAGLDTGDAIDARGRGAWAPRPNGNGQNGNGGARPGGESAGGRSERRDTVAAVSVFISRAKGGMIALSPKSVVVLDELGTVGTRQMLELLRLQEKHGFRMVAIGDPKQCQSIEAGAVIGLLEKALGKVPAIETTVRQTNARAKEIANLLRQGDAKAVAQALEMKRADHTAEIVPGGTQDAIERAATLWDERRKANAGRERYSLSVSTPTNEDARAIGEVIRKRLQASGELERDQMVVRAIDKNTGERYALPIAAGDKVRLFARTNAAIAGSKGSIGDNGSILTVTAVRQGGLVLRNDRGREGFVKWETLADKASGRMRLAYGYAMTTNTAQGITSTEHIFVTPRGSQTTDGFRSYVSGSRHRERGYWLTSEGAEKQEIGGRRPLGDPRPIREPDIWASWARNVARQPEKANALDLVELSEAARREAARDFLKGLAADERRQAERHPSALPHRFAETHIYARQGERVAESMTFSAWYHGRMLVHMERAVPTVQRAIAAGWERARPLIEEARQVAQARVQQMLGGRQAPGTSQASNAEPSDGLNAYWRGRIEQGKAARAAREAAMPEGEREGRTHGRTL